MGCRTANAMNGSVELAFQCLGFPRQYMANTLQQDSSLLIIQISRAYSCATTFAYLKNTFYRGDFDDRIHSKS